MKKSKKNNKGFSLVELIVVVLILGILAVAVTPQIMNWINKSKIAKDESYAGSVATAIESVTLEYLGKNKTADIVGNMVISGSPTATLAAGSGVTPTAGQLQYIADVTAMIGSDKLQIPEQSGKSTFVITVTPNATTSTVNVTVTAN